MPSKAKRDFEVFTGALRRKFKAGDVDLRDVYARKWPHDFEFIPADTPPKEGPKPVNVEIKPEGGDE
ncbi:hypothetical protein C4571_02160 [Candidatus Parcubacteria bacterium]|nr:MAG: hypothetical protein C4571_02160 [Candidatus Parcubacteria bacterium]